MKQVTAPVIANNEIMPAVQLIWLDSAEIAAQARPGQFVMVKCDEENLLRRPFSIHQRDGSKIALLFQVIGKGTVWLSQCKAGDNVDIFGPLGNGFTIQHTAKNILLVAGGTGIAPLCFLTDEAIKRKKEVTLLRGASSSDYQLPDEYLYTGILNNTEALLKDIILTDDDSGVRTGLVTDYIVETITDLARVYGKEVNQIFACGPLPMYKTMAQMPELKDRPVQISLEMRMGCGLGVCYGCTVKTKSGLRQVCKDGPVFDLKDILWDDLNI